jgi:hypothetical protein
VVIVVLCLWCIHKHVTLVNLPLRVHTQTHEPHIAVYITDVTQQICHLRKTPTIPKSQYNARQDINSNISTYRMLFCNYRRRKTTSYLHSHLKRLWGMTLRRYILRIHEWSCALSL